MAGENQKNIALIHTELNESGKLSIRMHGQPDAVASALAHSTASFLSNSLKSTDDGLVEEFLKMFCDDIRATVRKDRAEVEKIIQ